LSATDELLIHLTGGRRLARARSGHRVDHGRNGIQVHAHHGCVTNWSNASHRRRSSAGDLIGDRRSQLVGRNDVLLAGGATIETIATSTNGHTRILRTVGIGNTLIENHIHTTEANTLPL
jgi:hypothetical protein